MSKEIENGLIVKASFMRETKDSYYLDCEGDPVWVPKKSVNFDSEKESLELPKWLYKKIFPNEPV